ncbi:MAG: Protein translocase subunit SecF [Candidatus Falkowbacteria bacterium GW2011_GWF2_39_8]|uniref:Protein-export membrane protein SecF n=1 Tax=Candidatus Falkowbacteria bacterium GW2011_GWF2_39_8 TaxID=1618642 RepID=A0A0G0S8I5_9BACT|nr:MAG: Protein translocase subunit SecF [Candidatus Falkowbacteria bacterium GW2011_GWF2_39_8]
MIFGAALLTWGFKFGVDFTGGSLLEVNFTKVRPDVTEMQKALSHEAVGNLGSLVVQPLGETQASIRFQESTEEKHLAVLGALKKLAVEKDKTNTVEELRFDSVGPSIGQELKSKSINAIFFVLLAIVLYISYAFRKVSKPVASWKYGLAALIAMFHDVIITLGIFSVLGKFYGVEINTSFVAAILTVIGYSVHDTIVVFDRLRENLPKSHEDFEGTVNTSLNQTLVRSINTSVTVLLTLVAITIFGGSSIRSFALALTIGIFIGTYSSIFVASPVLVVWEKMKKS